MPAETARLAHQWSPKTKRSRLVRDAWGTVETDQPWAAWYPPGGPSAASPWRVVLVRLMPFLEHSTDRQAAEAVRRRIDGKAVRRLERTDVGVDCSVLSASRDRLMAGGMEEPLRSPLRDRCREQGGGKAPGKQRTASTPVLAAIRAITRLEQVGERLRAA